MRPAAEQVITVTLNTAIDRVLEVPGLEVGSHVRAREIQRYAAGKAINVSRALARLGRASIATGFVGTEQREMFERFLAQTGPGRIDPQLLSVRGRTRENITLIDPVRHTDTHLRDEGFEVTARDIQRIQDKLALLAVPDAWVVISGSLPRGMSLEQLNGLLQSLVDKRVRLVLDLGGQALRELKLHRAPVAKPARGSGRGKKAPPPPVVAVNAGGVSPVAGAAGASQVAVVALPGAAAVSGEERQPLVTLIKPNRNELAELIGAVELQLSSDESIISAVRNLGDLAQWVAVTLGADGARLITPDRVWHGRISVPADKIVNTVGSGDCLVAGLIDGQLAGLEPDATLRRGIAVATANALSPGMADFNSREVKQLEAKVKIEPR